MVRVKGKNITQNFKELLVNLDEDLVKLLKKTGNGTLKKLTSQEREALWMMFSKKLKHHCQEINSDNTTALNNILEVLLFILTCDEANNEMEHEFVNLLTFLNTNHFILQDDSVRNNISLIDEHWLCKKTEIIPGMEYFILNYLLEVCSSDKPLVAAIQRLNSVRKFITAAPFENDVPSLRPQLIKLVQNQVVLNSEHGQRFIAHALLLSQRTMQDIHKTILLELSSCAKKKAICYAKIYVIAWQNAKNEMRTLLEKTCFQHVMESFVIEQRTSLELSKISHNLLYMLEIWHSERKKKNSDFITMITDCYQPFIWKYLQSGFNVLRCNATDLLLKAFPLQRPGDNVLDSERLFNQQFNAMAVALKDDCHIVRIIAVREVCNILTHYWNSFSPVQIQKLLTIISRENAHDASTADVRRMVYIGFQSFLDNPLSFEYLRQILPTMADNIHDVNQKVRSAFIQLLIAIKEKEDPDFKYSDVLPTFSFYYRLAEENIKVGQLIVRLLLSSYYHENMPIIEWTKRFIFLIKTYPKSYRNFFLYSEKVLPFSSACTIIFEIIVQVGNYVLSKTTIDNPDVENEVIETRIKKIKLSKKKIPLRPTKIRKNIENENIIDKSQKKECAFDDPLIVEGLFDIVTILWVLHDNKLNKTENHNERVKLYEAYIKYAQPFINYYKDTELINSVLSLSGNIPSSLLRSNNITLPGYCMKMLKSNQHGSGSEVNCNTLPLIVALIKWGKGSDVLEQVTLWLDAAFETQDLNSTILPRRRVKISETIQPNSVVAINILDTLMKTEYVKMSILKKNYAQLFELWKFMSRVKKLIETRLEQGEPYENELVSDKFIKICFRRYVKLIPLFKDNKVNVEKDEKENETDLCVNYQQEINDLLEWAQEVLYPLLDECQGNRDIEEIELITSVYNDILYVADNLITLHVVNRQFYTKISHLIVNLLKTRYGVYFVKSASRIATAINYSGKLLFNVDDDLQIFSRIVPCIVSYILSVLTRNEFSSNEMTVISSDIEQMKTNLGKILNTYHDNFKIKINSRATLKQLQVLIGIFQDALITLLSKGISSTSDLSLYKTIKEFPLIIGSILSLFYNKFWGPMFIHVMNASLMAKLYEGKSLLASVVILYFFGNNDNKMNKAELIKTISLTSNALNKMKLNVAYQKNSILDGRSSTPLFNEDFREGTPSSAVVEIDSFTNERNSEIGLLPEELIQRGLDILSELLIMLTERRIEEE